MHWTTQHPRHNVAATFLHSLTEPQWLFVQRTRRAGLGGRRRSGLRLRSRAVDRRPPSSEHAARRTHPRTRRYAPRLHVTLPWGVHPTHSDPLPTLGDTNCAKHKISKWSRAIIVRGVFDVCMRFSDSDCLPAISLYKSHCAS